MLITIFPCLWHGTCTAFTAAGAEHAEKGGNRGKRRDGKRHSLQRRDRRERRERRGMGGTAKTANGTAFNAAGHGSGPRPEPYPGQGGRRQATARLPCQGSPLAGQARRGLTAAREIAEACPERAACPDPVEGSESKERGGGRGGFHCGLRSPRRPGIAALLRPDESGLRRVKLRIERQTPRPRAVTFSRDPGAPGIGTGSGTE